MKAGLALLLAAVPALAAAQTVRIAPEPFALVPSVAAAAVPLALSEPLSLFAAARTPSLLPSPLPALLPAALAPLPLTPVAAVETRALPVLSALTVRPAASMGEGWDGSGPHESEDSYAFAERAKLESHAVQHARAEIPVVDHLRGAYAKEGAAEMMRESYIIDEKRNMTGVELLSFVVTPEALDPDLTPDPDRVDFARLGKTSAQIRETLAAREVPYHSYERWLRAAFREGLIYRLFNKNTGLTYYGVPPRVRADWGLEPEKSAPAVETPAIAAGPTPFSLALTQLAADAEKLPKHEELFEFTAQAVDAAIKAGRLPKDAVSAKFRTRADALGYDLPSLEDAVLTLMESAEGTPWEARTAALRSLL